MTSAVAGAMASLLGHLEWWEGLRHEPGACDLVLGNPQEMPLPGFVSAIRHYSQPLNKDWFAYKRSEPEAREVVARSLREWRGLPFEPACLKFWLNNRAVRTASAEQVRQPIFNDGLDQWRHYEPWLGDLRSALGDSLIS